jgi:hypothetical protein
MAIPRSSTYFFYSPIQLPYKVEEDEAAGIPTDMEMTQFGFLDENEESGPAVFPASSYDEGFRESTVNTRVNFILFSRSKVPAEKRTHTASLQRVKQIIDDYSTNPAGAHSRFKKAMLRSKVLMQHKIILLSVFKHNK